MSDLDTLKPDPSALTTAQILREVVHLKELLETRVDAVEKAIEVAHEDLVRVPTAVQEAVGTLKELHGERFNGVEKQFKERDFRDERALKENKEALAAALAAAKELVTQQNTSNALGISKSETATTKQIDQLGSLIQQITKGFDEKIDDVKGRMTRIEGRGEGVATNKTEHQASNTLTLAIIAAIIGVAGIVVAVILKGN